MRNVLDHERLSALIKISLITFNIPAVLSFAVFNGYQLEFLNRTDKAALCCNEPANRIHLHRGQSQRNRLALPTLGAWLT